MAKSRLNFCDHPDGTFSCQAIFFGGYDPASPAHQTVRILEEHLHGTNEEVPPDAMDDPDEANRPTSETEAFMQLSDVGEGFRLNLRYLPTPQLDSPAHQACRQAHVAIEFLNKAVSDALMTRAGGDVQMVVSRQRINAHNGN